jgi:two-component system response regulator VicR
MKVLIVDDDRTLSDLIAFMLRREGYETVQVYDGESALQRWQEGGLAVAGSISPPIG